MENANIYTLITKMLQGVRRAARPAGKNAILYLLLKRSKGVWHFTDERRKLVKEPFVAGIPEIIEDLLDDYDIPLKKAKKGLQVMFSGREFPGAMLCLERGKAEMGGRWYHTEDGEEGWLCPALFRFFKTAPKKLHVAVRLAPADE